MSIDTSINNVGEYYSSHYLTSTFSKDVKALIAKWREQGADAVPRLHRGGCPPLGALSGRQPVTAAGPAHLCPGPLSGLRPR
jgi:hypothetical protein